MAERAYGKQSPPFANRLGDMATMYFRRVTLLKHSLFTNKASTFSKNSLAKTILKLLLC